MSDTIRLTKDIKAMLKEFQHEAVKYSEKEIEIAILQKRNKEYIEMLKEEMEDKKHTCESCLIRNALKFGKIYFKECGNFLEKQIKKIKKQ